MAYFTLYASIEEQLDIHELIVGTLQDYECQQDEENQITVWKKSLLRKKKIAVISTKKRNANDDPNLFTQGFVGYLTAELKGEEEMRQSLIRQAIHTNTIIAFDIEDDRIESFWGHFLQITTAITGIIYLQSGFILDDNGDELVDHEGHIVAERMKVSIVENRAQFHEQARATIENQGRRQATHALLEANAIRYIEHLPLLPDSKMVQLQSVEEIGRRAAVLIILIQYVRELLDESEKVNQETAKRMSEVFLNRYGVKSHLTDEEVAFLEQKTYEKQELIDKMWLYEAAYVMLWSIGLIDELKEPSTICNVDLLLDLIANHANVGELLQEAEMRPTIDILDRMDVNYSYHWACVDARVNGYAVPLMLDEGVVLERQRAFNWLINLDDEKWDDVSINS